MTTDRDKLTANQLTANKLQARTTPIAEQGDPKHIFAIPSLPKPSLRDEITATKSVTKAL